jgi:hypothetical protein
MSKPSAESLSIAAISIPVRPDPPSDFTPEQSKIWRDVVNTKPPEWFESDTYPILRAYCVAADYHVKIQKEMDTLKITDATFRSLLDLLTKQAKVIGELAVKMRLTQQSRYTPKAANTANKRVSGGGKPWDQ